MDDRTNYTYAYINNEKFIKGSIIEENNNKWNIIYNARVFVHHTELTLK